MAEKFYTSISLEPSTGAVRGKVPATLVKALDADDGDVIEYKLTSNGFSGRLMSSKEARAYKAESGRGGGVKKSTAKPKKKGKKVTEKPVSKKSKKAGSKKGRKTEVEYDKPKKKGKKVTIKPLKKKGKKGKR